MPFRSNAQRKYMFAKHPKLAREWVRRYGAGGSLPEHVLTRRVAEKMKKR